MRKRIEILDRCITREETELLNFSHLRRKSQAQRALLIDYTKHLKTNYY